MKLSKNCLKLKLSLDSHARKLVYNFKENILNVGTVPRRQISMEVIIPTNGHLYVSMTTNIP